MNVTIKNHLVCLILLFIAARITYLLLPAGQAGDADEAVFGLMALKIAALEEFPVFCWKAEYAGAPVSYIAAIFFKMFGPGFVPLRSVMLLFGMGTPLLFYFIYKRISGSASFALCGALLIVFCPFLALRYTMAALGGYGETFLGAGIIILLSWKIMENPESPGRRIFVLGTVCGFFLFILSLIIPAIVAFALPVLMMIKKNRIRNALFFLGGIATGTLPLILYSITHSASTIMRSLGRITSLGSDEVNAPILKIVIIIIRNKCIYLKTWLAEAPSLFGQYILPEDSEPVHLRIAGILLIALFLFFIIRTLFFTKSQPEKMYAIHFSLFMIAIVIFAWIGNLSRARHLLPLLLALPAALFSPASMVKSIRVKKLVVAAFILLYGINVAALAAERNTIGFNAEPVVAAFIKNKIRCFYGSYWSVYPIMFASKGTLFGSPMLLPYHEILTDRRPDYTDSVRAAAQPAFFFIASEMAIEKEFQSFCMNNRITSRRERSPQGVLYYDLSKPIDAVVKTKWKTEFMVREYKAKRLN
jgi:hypothetical protein